jgi:hypothetical protein
MNAKHMVPRRSGSALLGVLLALGALGGCSQETGPHTITLILTISVNEPVTLGEMKRAGGRLTSITMDPDGTHCQGGGGFAGFRADSPIEIFNERGMLLGKGALGKGALEEKGRDLEGQQLFRACNFLTTLPLVRAAKIYILRISGEGFVRRFHAARLREQKGIVSLTLN